MFKKFVYDKWKRLSYSKQNGREYLSTNIRYEFKVSNYDVIPKYEKFVACIQVINSLSLITLCRLTRLKGNYNGVYSLDEYIV